MIKFFLTAMTVCLLSPLAHADFNFDQYVNRAGQIPVEEVRGLTVMQNGRLKPLESLARETSIYITGAYSFKGLHAVQLVLGLMLTEDAENLQMIEVRSPDLRKRLGLPLERRHYSMKELLATSLEKDVAPLFEKQKANKRLLTEVESKMIEAYEQASTFQGVVNGGIVLEAMEPQLKNGAHPEVMQTSPVVLEFKQLMQALGSQDRVGTTTHAQALSDLLQKQNWPPEIKAQTEHVGLELFYNSFKPFRWACWLFFLIAGLMLLPMVHLRLPHVAKAVLALIPILFVALGLYLRVTITGFAPVTNMFGTMIWVSLGVGFFGWIFFLIYRNAVMLAVTSMGAFALLLITEQIPLVISPDMDPIVAVLRSNLWLTIHVLTITISYAAFSIAMLLGNTMLVRDLLGLNSSEWIKTYGHFCYRAIQLGVFLLSVGIILGGVWADYSWGRFWGWDPKETWALIADLGFIVLLHARLIGWVDAYRLLLIAPLSYLLVIMAWYGVNFILATGLHSYGFSSGGATIVAVFVLSQLALVGLALGKKMIRLKPGGAGGN